jgi:hypothetical protein
MTNQTVDHFERVNLRREALIREASDNESALLMQIADKRQQVRVLLAEADKLARAHHTQRANDTKAAAATLEEDIRRLTNVDLPRLRIEAENIRQYRTPELAAQMNAANNRQRTTQTDRSQKLCNDLTTAKCALIGHLVSLATTETLRLAEAVGAAEIAAAVDSDDFVRALRSLLRSKKAA